MFCAYLFWKADIGKMKNLKYLQKNPAQIEEQKQTAEIVKNVNIGFLTKAKQKLTIPK